MFQTIKDAYYVAWGDMCFMKHNFWNILVSSVMSPLLYLLAFGYGLGNGITMEGVPYIAFIIPGIAALTSLSASFSSTATRLNVQRLYYKSFDEMLMCPLSPASIILGKSFLGLFRGLVGATLIYILGMCVTSELYVTPMLIVSVVLSCFTFSFLGVMAALLAKSHQSMATFSSMIILPMTFLCGTFFSAAAMPAWFQAILYALPLTHSSSIIRAAALDWSFPWISLVVLFAFCVAFFVIDVYLVKARRI
ncbi:MAG: ABC transporter permease [Candidatus Methanomethylophilaceae archaeon]